MNIVDSQIAYKGHFKMMKYTVRNENGKTYLEECFERGHAVAAVVWDSNIQRFIFTKQFRIGAASDSQGTKTELIEIVAGSMDKENETPVQALVREIEEELGYRVSEEDNNITHIASVYVSPGGTSEKVHIYLVEVSQKVSEGGGVEDENISIVEMTAPEVLNWMPEIDDAKTFLGVLYIMNKLNYLPKNNI